MAKKSKIKIKPENKGKFTDYCGGKVTAECIARGKRSPSATIRKRATFAANARKWNKEFGGPLVDEPVNIGVEVSKTTKAPYWEEPIGIAKTLVDFSKDPKRYKMSGMSYDLTSDILKKYPDLNYVKDLPVMPKKYTTGIDLSDNSEFRYPVYTGNQILDSGNYSFVKKQDGGYVKEPKDKEKKEQRFVWSEERPQLFNLIDLPAVVKTDTTGAETYLRRAKVLERQRERERRKNIDFDEGVLDEMSFGGILADVAQGAGSGALAGGVLGGVSAIPGALIGGATGLIKGIFGHAEEKRAQEEAEQQAEEQRLLRHQQIKLNRLPQAKYGGMLEYSGDSHNAPSGGIPVDANGNPVAVSKNSPVALTEDKEVVWFDPDEGQPYIFSEKSGFAKDLRTMNKRFKLDTDQSMARFDPLIDEAVKKKFTDAKVAQEIYNAKKGKSTTMKCGGKLPRKDDGGDIPNFWKLAKSMVGENAAPIDIARKRRELMIEYNKLIWSDRKQGLEQGYTFSQKYLSDEPTSTINTPLTDNIIPETDYLSNNRRTTASNIPEDYIPYGQRDYGDVLSLNPNRRLMQTYNVNTPTSLPEFDFEPIRGFDYYNTPSVTATETPITRPKAPAKLAPKLGVKPIDTTSLVGLDNIPKPGDNIVEDTPTLSPLGHILSGVGAIADYAALRANKPEKVNLGRMAPERVSYASDRLAAEEEALMARRMNATAARNAGVNAGQVLGTTATANTGVNRLLGQTKSKSFQDEINANAAMRMQTNQMNAQLAAQEAAMNAEIENEYNAQLAYNNPIAALARTGASYFADNAAYQRGYDTLRMLAPNARITKPEDYNTWDWLTGKPYDVDFTYYQNT